MIPFELITMIGSTFVGGILKLWGMKQKDKENQTKALMAAAGINFKNVEAARQFGDKPGVQWTRRALALSAFGAIIVWPLLAPLFGLYSTHGYTEFEPGFWFLTEGQEVLKWKSVDGIAITPLHTNLIAAISGMYFGGSLVGHNR